jgi:hypothetical protein
MVNEDLSEIINADQIILFDAEDDPDFFEPKLAYHSLKDKCEFYAKLVYREKEVNKDGLKYIAFPIENFGKFLDFCELPSPSNRLSPPLFIGSPAYLNFWEAKDHHFYCETDDFNPISYFEPDDSFIYSQRFDWLETFTQNNIKYTGGVVFKPEALGTTHDTNAHSLNFQRNHFGKAVEKYSMPYTHPLQLMMMQLGSKIGISPTGHDRYSWRVFDIMAAGSILLVTDLDDRTMLYNPEVRVTVPDGKNIVEVLEEVRMNEVSLLSEHKKNREILKGKTPEVIWNDFLKQMD